MQRTWLYVLVFVGSFSAQLFGQSVPNSGQARQSATDPARRFDYDSSLPLDSREAVVDERGGVVVTELTYASPLAGRVTATLVAPARSGRYPALLFGHWGYGDRREFLPEAEQWARAGVVCLLPDYPWVRPEPWRRNTAPGISDPETDLAVMAQAVVDLRRGLDLLAARPDVDPKRIAYVGHSYGAQFGAILSAIDDRIQAAALVAGVGRTADLFEHHDPNMRAFRAANPAEQLTRYLEVVGVLDAIRWVPRARPTPLLFQFALHDRGYSIRSMERYGAAASEPKRILWYATGHELNDPQAWLDRAEWLQQVAGLPAPGTAPSGSPIGRRAIHMASLQEAELEFARAAREQGQRQAWLAWFAPDGVMFRRGPVHVHDYIRGHPDLPLAPPGAFDWRPVYGDVSEAGDLGYSTGPVRLGSSERSEHWFFSVWRRQADGEWRVAVDLGTSVVISTPDPFDAPYQPASPPHALGSPVTAAELVELDRLPRAASVELAELLDPDVRAVRTDLEPIVGRAPYIRILKSLPGRLTHKPAGSGVSTAGDMGYSYGQYAIEEPSGETGAYVRAWRRNPQGRWRIMFDLFHRNTSSDDEERSREFLPDTHPPRPLKLK